MNHPVPTMHGSLPAPARCPLCDTNETRILSLRARDGTPLKTVLCTGCGLGRVDPIPKANELREFYSAEYRVRYQGSFEPKPYRVLRSGRAALARIAIASQFMEPGQSVLDIGCGGGEFVYLMTRAGFDARGHEADPRLAAYARRELGIAATDGPWEAVRGGADLVTLFHSLEHLDHPVQALRDCAAWLNAGGKLLVEVPNIEFPLTRSSHRFHYAHLYHFNEETLRACAIRAGLTPLASLESADGGNLIAVFSPGHASPSRLTGNCERILRVEARRSEWRYWTSPRTLVRSASRLYRHCGQRIAARSFPNSKALLDSLVAG